MATENPSTEPQQEPVLPGVPLRPDPGSPETRGGNFETKIRRSEPGTQEASSEDRSP